MVDVFKKKEGFIDADDDDQVQFYSNAGCYRALSVCEWKTTVAH